MPCNFGYYRTNLDHAHCSPCPAGYACADPSDPPEACPAGHFSTLSSGLCSLCPEGFYSETTARADGCTPCPERYSCTNRSAAPVKCAYGTFSRAGQGTCTPSGGANTIDYGKYSVLGGAGSSFTGGGCVFPASGDTNTPFYFYVGSSEDCRSAGGPAKCVGWPDINHWHLQVQGSTQRTIAAFDVESGFTAIMDAPAGCSGSEDRAYRYGPVYFNAGAHRFRFWGVPTSGTGSVSHWSPGPEVSEVVDDGRRLTRQAGSLRTAIACNSSTMQLSCPSGSVIRVLRAAYGRGTPMGNVSLHGPPGRDSKSGSIDEGICLPASASVAADLSNCPSNFADAEVVFSSVSTSCDLRQTCVLRASPDALGVKGTDADVQCSAAGGAYLAVSHFCDYATDFVNVAAASRGARCTDSSSSLERLQTAPAGDAVVEESQLPGTDGASNSQDLSRTIFHCSNALEGWSDPSSSRLLAAGLTDYSDFTDRSEWAVQGGPDGTAVIGEWMEITLPTAANISHVRVAQRAHAAGQSKRLRLDFNDSSQTRFIALPSLSQLSSEHGSDGESCSVQNGGNNWKCSAEMTTFVLRPPVIDSHVRITIEDVYTAQNNGLRAIHLLSSHSRHAAPARATELALASTSSVSVVLTWKRSSTIIDATDPDSEVSQMTGQDQYGQYVLYYPCFDASKAVRVSNITISDSSVSVTGLAACSRYSFFVGSTLASEAQLSDPLKVTTKSSDGSDCQVPAPCQCVSQPDTVVYTDQGEDTEMRRVLHGGLTATAAELSSCSFDEP